MAKEQTCPICRHRFEPKVSIPTLLPPTGGDYEWVEGIAKLRCPHCQGYLEASVRQYIRSTHGEILSLRRGKDPNWTIYQLAFSADEQHLIACSAKETLVFSQQGPQDWPCILRTEGKFHHLEGEYLYTEYTEYKGALCQEWHLPTATLTWSKPVDKWRETLIIGRDEKAGIFVRGGSVEGYHIAQHLELHDLQSGETQRIKVADTGSTQVKSRMYLNLPRRQILCLRSEMSRKNAMDLWQFDKQGFQKLATYHIDLSLLKWAGWLENGDIIAVESHNHRGYFYYDFMPYGLVHLEKDTLRILKQQKQLDQQICPHRVEMRHIQYLPPHQLLVQTNGAHLVDVETFAYTATPDFKVSPYDVFAVSLPKKFLAIARNNDLQIYNMLTKQRYSVRYKRLIK